MKKMRIVLLLIFLLSFFIFAISISAAESPLTGTCGDNAYWTYDKSTKTLTISGTGAIYDYDMTFLGYGRDDVASYKNAPSWCFKQGVYGNFEKLIIEDGITRIGNVTFYAATKLREVYMGSGITSIGNKAFCLCEALTQVTFSGSLIEIGEEAFWMAKNLSKVDLPDTLVTLGEMAFAETALTSLKLPASIVTVGNDAIPLTVREIHFPKNLKEIDIIPFGDFERRYVFDKITVDPENPYYRIEDGCFIKNEEQTIYYAPEATAIPEGIRVIGGRAFEGDTNLPADLVIPEGVEIICSGAFRNCTGLRSVQFPKTLKVIGQWVFDGCYGIESISLDPSNENYYVEGMSMIQKSDNKLVLHFAPAPIPEGVTHIDNDTIVCGDERYELQEGIEYVESHFILGRNLKELTLPRSLTYLHAYALVECPVITDIYYKGTRAEWNALTANFKEEAGRNWTDEKIWFNRVAVHCIDEIEETTAGSESETEDPNVTTQPPTSSETQSPTPTGCGSTVNLPWIALVMIVPIAVMGRKRRKR